MMAPLKEDTLVQATTADYLEEQLGCAIFNIFAHSFFNQEC